MAGISMSVPRRYVYPKGQPTEEGQIAALSAALGMGGELADSGAQQVSLLKEMIERPYARQQFGEESYKRQLEAKKYEKDLREMDRAYKRALIDDNMLPITTAQEWGIAGTELGLTAAGIIHSAAADRRQISPKEMNVVRAAFRLRDLEQSGMKNIGATMDIIRALEEGIIPSEHQDAMMDTAVASLKQGLRDSTTFARLRKLAEAWSVKEALRNAGVEANSDEGVAIAERVKKVDLEPKIVAYVYEHGLRGLPINEDAIAPPPEEGGFEALYASPWSNPYTTGTELITEPAKAIKKGATASYDWLKKGATAFYDWFTEGVERKPITPSERSNQPAPFPFVERPEERK